VGIKRWTEEWPDVIAQVKTLLELLAVLLRREGG
jgi:hypothetical protein